MDRQRLVLLGIKWSAFMTPSQSRNRVGPYNAIVKMLCTAPQEKTHECLFVCTSADADFRGTLPSELRWRGKWRKWGKWWGEQSK